MDNEVDNFLNEVKGKEPENPFQENESPFLADEDEKGEVVVEADSKEDKPVPFHKDPKVEKYLAKRERELRAELLGELKPAAPVKEEVKTGEVNLPESFVRLVGDDTYEKKTVLKDLSNYFGSLKGEAKAEALREFEQQLSEQQSRQSEEDQRALSELESGFEAIEEEFGVDADTPEFRAFIRKFAPKDSEGNVVAFPDMVSTYETYQQVKKPDNSRAKQLASRGLKRSSDASSVATPKDNSWSTWDRIKSSLS